MQNRSVGIAALIAAVWLLVGNLTHPVGTTDMYADGAALVEHTTNAYWIVNHLLLSLALLVPPWLVFAWSRTLTPTEARTWGTYAVILVGLGTVVGVLHLGGIDGVALPAYGEVLASGGAAAAVGADVLRKVHLASVTAWSLMYWGAAQTVMGITELMERTRRWLGWLLVVCGARLRFRRDYRHSRPTHRTFRGTAATGIDGRAHRLAGIDRMAVCPYSRRQQVGPVNRRRLLPCIDRAESTSTAE